MNPPRATSTAILEVLLAVEMAVLTAAAGGSFLPEVRLTCAVSV